MAERQLDAKQDVVTVEGVVTDILPGLEYMVEIEFQGLKHDIVCYVSGKMRKHYIQLEKGDEVRVEISLYDIDKGRIVYRLTQRNPRPPRGAK
jgi:translation initiation factor IF-1